MDLYGYQERSPTPDPGDDLNPPPGYDEDDLGGPAPPPPALTLAPAPPAPPAQVSFNHRTHTIHIQYIPIHINTYNTSTIQTMLLSKTQRLACLAQAEAIHARGHPCAITYDRTDGKLQVWHALYSGQNGFH